MSLKAELMNEFSGDMQKDNIFSIGMPAYQIEAASATVTYIRWQSSSTDDIFIKKISVSGDITTIEYAYDTWANRATATYTAIND